MALNDLTTLNNVKIWFNQSNSTNNTNDLVISTEITRVSSMILGWLDRTTLISQTITDVYDGMGGYRMPLRQFPVTSVSSVIVSNTTIPPGPSNTGGIVNSFTNEPSGGAFYFEPWDGIPPGRQQILSLIDGFFWRGANNVTVTYTAGYLAANEATTLPASGPMQVIPQALWGIPIKDAGVTYAATGAALTAVTSNPGQGQYVPPNPLNPVSPTDCYTFSSQDAGKVVLLNYSYVPYALEGAVCELVCERLSYRSRIGQKSKSLGGNETVSFAPNDLPAWVTNSIQPYRRLAVVS